MNTDRAQLNRFYNAPAPGWMAVSRGAALALAIIAGLNLVEILAMGTSSVQNWFCSFAPLNQAFSTSILAIAAPSLLLFTLRPALPSPVQLATMGVLLGIGGFCAWRIWIIQKHVAEAERTVSMLKPLGLMLICSVAGFGVLAGNSIHARGRSSFIAMMIAAALSLLAFLVVTIQSGGVSDSSADSALPAVIVISMPANDDGSVSEALKDRLETAAKLVTDGWAKKLIVCSLENDQSYPSVDAMAEVALAAGVPEQHLVRNSDGVEFSSVAAAAESQGLGEKRQIAIVSHWHELASLRLLGARRKLDVTAVAAKQTHALFGQNTLVAKEVMKLGKLYVEPLIVYAKSLQASQPQAPSGDENEADEKANEGDLEFPEFNE